MPLYFNNVLSFIAGDAANLVAKTIMDVSSYMVVITSIPRDLTTNISKLNCNEYCARFNKMLKKLVVKFPGMTRRIPIASYYRADGVHLNSIGNKRLANVIRTFVQGLFK